MAIATSRVRVSKILQMTSDLCYTPIFWIFNKYRRFKKSCFLSSMGISKKLFKLVGQRSENAGHSTRQNYTDTSESLSFERSGIILACMVLEESLAFSSLSQLSVRVVSSLLNTLWLLHAARSSGRCFSTATRAYEIRLYLILLT